jgi:hypothetical protein
MLAEHRRRHEDRVRSLGKARDGPHHPEPPRYGMINLDDRRNRSGLWMGEQRRVVHYWDRVTSDALDKLNNLLASSILKGLLPDRFHLGRVAAGCVATLAGEAGRLKRS